MSGVSEFSPLGGIWEIMELLGQGSYGKVYKAKRSELGEDYFAAVKHISVPQDQFYTDTLYENGVVTDGESVQSYYNNMLQSLMNEIKTSYRLKGYTNIVSYEDHYVFPKKDSPGYDLFIRMELLKTLQARLKEAPFTERDIIKLGIDICTALEILGRENILHRDIKPSNIFVNSAGEYKLGDFGVARILDKAAGGVSIRGTFEYMAPELQRGANIDRRADIYSLGLVLYHLCNGGRGPFLKPPPAQIDFTDNEKATERRLIGDALPAPANASIALSKIILTATQYQSDKRYTDAADMKNALNSLLNAEVASQLAEDGSGTISIYDGASTYGKSAGTPPRVSGAADQAFTPQFMGPQYQSTGMPYQAIPSQQPHIPPNSIPYGGGNASAGINTARKSGGNIPIIVILSVILVVVAVGVYLLLTRSQPESRDTAAVAEGSSEVADETSDDEDDITPKAPAVHTTAEAPAAHTTTEAPATEAAVNVPAEYILPDSSDRYLSDDDLTGLDSDQLTLARYEIFARYNCLMPDEWVQNYFNGCSWYNGYTNPDNFDEFQLSNKEIQNLLLLIQRRAELTGYIIPAGDSRYLTAIDLIGLNDSYTVYARNEPYAKHGRLFSVDWVRSYFENCPWYYGQIDGEYFDAHVNDYLNQYELENIKIIKAYETQHGY